MCNNIMVCKFLIQDLKVSLCIANLVHMTAVMVSPALKAQKQELSLQDRVTYNMKVLIAIRQTSQKDLAQAMGIAAPTLSQKFSGRTRWNMDDIEKASDFLDVKPEAMDLWVMSPASYRAAPPRAGCFQTALSKIGENARLSNRRVGFLR